MSNDTFPVAEGEDTAPYSEDDARNRKALVIAGGVAAALVVAAGAYFVFGGNSGSSTDTAFVPTHRLRPAVTAAAPTTLKKLPAPYKEQLGRDPFKALYVVPAVAPAAATVTTPTTIGTTPTTTGTGTTPTTAGSTGTTIPVSTRYTLKLLAISKPSPEVRFSTWSVGGTSKTVIPAQRFGKYGEIVVLAFSKNASGVVDQAIIQVGDDSPMNVKIGESISVL
jgi:hypothetical protein